MSDRKPAGTWWRSRFVLPDGGPSFSEIWTETKMEAEKIAADRGFGPPERYRGRLKEFRPSRLVALPGGFAREDVFHSICYIGFLAARSGAVTAAELVQDGSALHELAHIRGAGPNIRSGKQTEFTMAAIRHLEAITPGIPPDYVEMEMPVGGSLA
jgi:hypothetical protein